MTSTTESSNMKITICIVCIFIGLMLGIALHLAFPYIQYIEIQPSPMENPLEFYMNVLKDNGYVVEESPLSTNTYEVVTFNELLWILQTTNRTTCFIDYGERAVFPSLVQRVAKLWIQIDGIYYEVRFKGAEAK